MSRKEPFGADVPTALYRLYDAGGALLYVGVTKNPRLRMKGHQRYSPWWKACWRRTDEWYPGRPEALAAERAAISAENPVHNVMRPALVKLSYRKSVEPWVVTPRPHGPARPLYDARCAKGLTLAALSRRCGARGCTIGVLSLRRFECGTSLPRPRLIPVLTEILGIDVAYIYMRVEEERAA